MTVEENGKTGWETIYALTRALQFELGITTLSDSFGPATLSALQAKYPAINASTTRSGNFTRIIQAALYCKGYDGGEIDGVFNDRVAASIIMLKEHMGVSGVYPGSDLTPKVYKGLLNMDPYILVNYGSAKGSESIQAIQRWLNGRYIIRRDFFIIPCDGHHSRSVAKSMLFAIQYEAGLADGVANGVFGPTTQDKLRERPLGPGSSGVWVSLFSAALILNKRGSAFTSNFGTALSTATADFQSFSALPVTGTANFATWASLLVSYGDQSRRGAAADCVTTVTAARAQTLYSAGYRHVGRYLRNVPGSTLDKAIKPGELAAIGSSGLGCFPIYQTYGRGASYFDRNRGVSDAFDAMEWARRHGFMPNTRIYFAVDYDALDGEVTSNVLPYFQGVYETVSEASGYKVGIYGARNVCQRVSDAGYADRSFVCDMSSGFSGNLGYPLPTNWAFDQISTITVGSGDGLIEIDNNVASGRDSGQVVFNEPDYVENLDDEFDVSLHDAALADVRAYLESVGVPETGGEGWTADKDWATLGGNSSTRSFEMVAIGLDWLFTGLARELRIRKALIQAPVLWEMRKWNPADLAADEAVKAGLDDDCSTGIGQIFARVAIEARNYCVTRGIISGSVLDPAADLKAVWDKLYGDIHYNVKSVAYLTLLNAYQIGLPRPTVNTGFADVQKIIARYNGTNEAAAQYGRDVGGLYEVLERYHRAVREA
ncbi:glycoside hydrolase domain-containing protein [Myceligenerans crystallogenes]|uniref:DUF1906 domain-containing protein n=1 Tax=Myceligenerans crystallogenes TaxID=316335 RepID=A0ABN2NCK1_9MICO